MKFQIFYVFVIVVVEDVGRLNVNYLNIFYVLGGFCLIRSQVMLILVYEKVFLELVENYRLILLFLIVSKVMECCVCKRFYYYV